MLPFLSLVGRVGILGWWKWLKNQLFTKIGQKRTLRIFFGFEAAVLKTTAMLNERLFFGVFSENMWRVTDSPSRRSLWDFAFNLTGALQREMKRWSLVVFSEVDWSRLVRWNVQIAMKLLFCETLRFWGCKLNPICAWWRFKGSSGRGHVTLLGLLGRSRRVSKNHCL